MSAHLAPATLARRILVVLSAVTLMVLVAAALFFGPRPGVRDWASAASTPTATPGPFDFSIEIPGAGCSTKSGDTKCTWRTGSQFTVSLRLNGLGGIAGYEGFDAHLAYAGITYEEGSTTIVWPDCRFAGLHEKPGAVRAGCAIDIGAPSSWYSGLMLTSDFNCTANETAGNTITLVHGPDGDTSLISGDQPYFEDGTETLTINCDPNYVTPTPTVSPTPTTTPTPTPKPPGPKMSLDVKTAGTARDVLPGGSKGGDLGDCQTVLKEPSCDVGFVPGGETLVTISVVLSEIDLPDLDGDTKAGYTGFQARLNFPPVLGLKNRSSVSEVVWPDCDPIFALEGKGEGTYVAGCSIGPGENESTYLGGVMEVDFNCAQPGAFRVDLVIGTPANSVLVNELGSQVVPSKGDSVWINCIEVFDSDGDGCTDVRELGSDPTQGGQRDPNNFWDYGDMPDPNATSQRDQMIRVGDILRVVDRYGTDDDDGTAPINRNTDPLSKPPKTGYHPAYDRGGLVGPNPWDLAPPDGMIRIADIMAVVYQYGHDCA